MIVVHHLNNSRSQRIVWLLEELGLAYEIRKYQRDPVTMQAPLALRAIHPLGKSPLITEDGTTVAESGAIIEYLLERHGNGRFMPAPGSADKLRYTYWLHYAEGSAMMPLLLKLVFERVATSPMPFFARPIARAIARTVTATYIAPQIVLHLNYLEAELGKFDWFAGADFSGADIQLSFVLEAAASRGGLGEQHPHLLAFLARIHARPAYQRALVRGGTYELMK